MFAQAFQRAFTGTPFTHLVALAKYVNIAAVEDTANQSEDAGDDV